MKKCFYCDFYSVLPDDETAARVITEIGNEIRFFFEAIPDLSLQTIFIGGGTPSSLPAALFERILYNIASLSLNSLTEWSVEANPESLNSDFITLCRDYGVTRLSLGIQTTDDVLLETLGRKTRFADIQRSAESVSRYWQGDLNTDLIAGIPGQTPDTIASDIKYVFQQFNPSHVSLYALSVEKGTLLEKLIREKEIAPLSPGKQEKLWLAGARMLESRGMHQYEISNFAKPGKECLHNLNYWHLNPYIGVGPGAAATLPGSDQQVIRITHQNDLTGYLKGEAASWAMEYEEIDKQSFLFETCMMGFRLAAGIQRHQFVSRFGISLEDLVPGLWEEWQGRGVAVFDPDSYALTKKGQEILNPLLVEFSERLDACDRDLINVQWPE